MGLTHFAITDLFAFTMAPRVKDPTWIYVDVIDNRMYCKFCKKHIKRGGIHKLKKHLTGIRGQIAPYKAPTKEIGEIRLELQN